MIALTKRLARRLRSNENGGLNRPLTVDLTRPVSVRSAT